MKVAQEKIDLNHLDKTNWKIYRFDEIAHKISETVKPEEADVDTYVGLEHLDGEDIHIRRKGVPGDVKGGKLRCYPGDVIFGKRRAYQRKAAIVDFEGICSAHAFVFRANIDVIDAKLFPFFLHSDLFMHRMVDISVGGLSPTINWGDLKHQKFLLPPKEEQAQLAKLLWAMDEVIEKNQSMLDNLMNLIFAKKRLFFIEGNNSTETQKFFSYKVPRTWKLEKMSDVANVEYGISKSVANNTDPSIGWQIITGANINLDGSFDLEKKRYIEIPTKERFLLEYGDLMFNWRSGSPEHIGKTAFFDLDGQYTYASFILRIRCGDRLRNRYAFFLFNFLRDIEYFTKSISKQINFKINATIFREIVIPVPSIKEQDEMLVELEKFFEEKKLIQSHIQASKSLQKSIINQIF